MVKIFRFRRCPLDAYQLEIECSRWRRKLEVIVKRKTPLGLVWSGLVECMCGSKLSCSMQ